MKHYLSLIVECSQGTFLLKGASIDDDDCFPCPIGTYQDQEGQSNCTMCPLGMITNGMGAVNITECFGECLNLLFLCVTGSFKMSLKDIFTRVQFSGGHLGGGLHFFCGGMSILEHFVSCSLKWGTYFFKILNGEHPGGTDLAWGGGHIPPCLG